MGPPPAVAAVRRAVRESVADLPRPGRVVVAVSGGPDSTALLQAATRELPRTGLEVGLVTVDHGLQTGSAERARAVAQWGRALGTDPVEVAYVRLVTDAVGGAPDGGPEAAARSARRRVLLAAAARSAAAAILVGHTQDDQAETVLMRLARGSGARSLAGMAPVAGPFRRPFLALPREVVHEAARASDWHPWQDPHNEDRRFLRATVRHDVLPLLESTLGPGVAAALARTGELLRADDEALDLWAHQVLARASNAAGAVDELDVATVADVPRGVRRRVLHRFLVGAGVPAGALAATHVAAVAALVEQWHGQRGVDLPGGSRAVRVDGRVRLVPTPPRATEPGVAG